eukprot:gene131-742_t
MGCCCWKKTTRQVGCRNSNGVDLRDNLSYLYRRDSSGTRGQVPTLTKRKRRTRKRRQQPVDSSSSDTVDKNLRVLRVLPRQSLQSLQHLPNDGVLGLPGQVYGIPSKAAFEEPQKAAVEDARQDGYEADLSESADSTEIKEDSIEVKDHSIQVCSSVLEDILNAVSQRVAEAEVIARIRANFENNKEGEFVMIHSGDSYVIDAPDASTSTCESRNPNDHFEDAEPEIVIARFSISDYNIEEDETVHSEDVAEICTESDSPCLDNGALAVQDTGQCGNEAQVANEQTTKEKSFDDSKDDDIALSDVTGLAQAVPIESLEDTVVPVDGNADVDQPESLSHLKDSKTESNICQPQQNTLQAAKDPVIVKVCSSFLEGIVNAICEEVEATDEVAVEQDGSDADGAFSDILGSSVKDAPDSSCPGICVSICPISAQIVQVESLEGTVVPVVANSDVESVNRIATSDQSLLDNGSNIDDQRESLNHLEDSKTESNICQPQKNTLEAEKDPVIVEVCSSFLEGILNAVCQEVEETNEVEVEQDGSHADGASSDYLGSCVMEAPDASTCTCESRNPTDYFEDTESPVEPEIVIARLSVSDYNIEEDETVQPFVEPETVVARLVVNNDNIEEDETIQPHSEDVSEICTDSDSPCLDNGALAVQDINQCGSEAQIANDQTTEEKSFDDSKEDDIVLSNVTGLAQAVPIESLEDTVVPVVANSDVDSVNRIATSDQSLLDNGSNIDDQRESLNHLEDSKTESNICQPQQNTLEAEKDPVIVKVCSSFLEGIVNAICEEVEATDEVAVEQDGSDADGAFSDILGSSVKDAPDSSCPGICVSICPISAQIVQVESLEGTVVPVVANSDVESVNRIATSDQSLLDNGSNIDDQRESLNHLEDSKTESNICQPQKNTLEAENDPVIVEVCSSFLEGILNAVCQEVEETNEVEVEQDGSHADGASSDYLGSCVMEAPDASTCTCESRNPTDYFEDTESPVEPEIVIARLSVSDYNIEEDETVQPFVEPETVVARLVVNNDNIEEDATIQPHSEDVSEICTDSDSPCLDNGALAVQDINQCGSEAQIANDQTTEEKSFDDSKEDDIALLNVTGLAQVAPMESLEDTVVPVVGNADVDSISRIDTSDQSLLANGSNIDDKRESLNHQQDSKTESDICQPQQNTLEVQKDRFIVVACSSFLEGILNAVCKEVEAMNEVEVEQDGSDADGASSDYLGSCVMEAPDASTCTCEIRNPTDYFEDTESPVEPEIVIARLSVSDYNIEEDKTVQPFVEPETVAARLVVNNDNIEEGETVQPPSGDVPEICTESDLPCLDNGALAVQDTNQCGNEAEVANDQNTKEKSFDDSKEDDIALSDVTGLAQAVPMENMEDTPVPVVGNAYVDQPESLNHLKDSKTESNICQPQQNTLEAAKDPVIVEVCSSFLEGIVNAVCEKVEATNEVEVEQGGSDADGASSDYLGSCVMEAPDASTCTCETHNANDYFEDEETFIQPETVIARLSLSNRTIEEGETVQPFVEPETVIARLTLSEDNFEEEDSVQPVWDFVLESCAEDKAAK